MREDGALRGMVGLGVQEARSAELGYWLAPEARGRGLMHRAVRLVLDFAFDPDGLDLERVSWQAYVGNLASLAVAWRCGFRLEGQVRGHALQRGRRRDAWVGTLLRGDPRGPVSAWPGSPLLAGTLPGEGG